ncbi:hypothetical protein GOP47_0015960 [Adiantum capillus-veneris]|uniref:Uncharacterized protein n=1 Tax=Adiantum capillus-veneris TaxID=13818 RepID=A0A9D4UL91_ADICA|nr:hypothetical protein GOP47_0015960 [Adiantum capillus-veneris]
MEPNVSSRRKRSLAIDFPHGSLPADNPPLKKSRTVYQNAATNGGNKDLELYKVWEHDATNPCLEDPLQGLVGRALTPHWQEAVDASPWLHAPLSPYPWPDLQTSPSIVEHTHLQHHLQNESEICNPLETCKFCEKHDVCPHHHEICHPCVLEVSLKGFEMSVKSLHQAVDNWAWKKVSGSATENVVPYKEEQNERLSVLQHPAPWLIPTHWVPTLLMACAKSISKEDMVSTNHLMWVLNSLSSSKDASLDCRMASYFVHALHCKVKGIGHALQKRVTKSIQNLNINLDLGMKKLLMWREVTPWSAFGQEASNAAIFEALKGEDRVHVVDVSHWSCLCMQWPTLVEALATRREGAPHLRLTVVIMRSEGTVRQAMKAISNKITRFAHLMGLPSFKFKVIYDPTLEKIDAQSLDVGLGEALVVNLNQTLQCVPIRGSKYGGESPRDMVLRMLCTCNPKIMVIVENEVDQLSNTFAERFCSLYQFVSVFVGSMDRPDMPANQARLHVQEEVAKIMIVNSIACDENNGEERIHGENSLYHENPKREQLGGWAQRLSRAGFQSVCLEDDVLHRVKMLLKMYPSYWGLLHGAYEKDASVGELEPSPRSLTLTWRDYPIHTCTVWAPMQ